MSTTIKEIKIPKNCGECIYRRQININKYICGYPAGDYLQMLHIDAFKIDLSERPEWCPAEEFKRRIDQLSDENKTLLYKILNDFREMLELINKNKLNEEK